MSAVLTEEEIERLQALPPEEKERLRAHFTAFLEESEAFWKEWEERDRELGERLAAGRKRGEELARKIVAMRQREIEQRAAEQIREIRRKAGLPEEEPKT